MRTPATRRAGHRYRLSIEAIADNFDQVPRSPGRGIVMHGMAYHHTVAFLDSTSQLGEFRRIILQVTAVAEGLRKLPDVDDRRANRRFTKAIR